MAALELRDPVLFRVLSKAGDAPPRHREIMCFSTHADSEQHVTLLESLDRVRYSRLQHHCLAGGKAMLCRSRFDCQFTAKTMNYDLPWSPMLGQATAGLEGEQQNPEIATVDQASLAVTALPLMRFLPQTTREVCKSERYYGARHSNAGVRPEPLI